jgi:uncharacterized membrane protein (UPF0182 family)
VHERLRTLLPFFTQGTVVTPIVLGDSLFWTVDLYAASAAYPLSQHVQIAGDERTYFQHAATAVLYASTGETFIVADSGAGPPAQTWIKRFPTLFVPWSALPPALHAAIPPAIDGLRAQAAAFAQYGTRFDSDVPRHLIAIDGADSALVGTLPVFVTRRSGSTAVGLILLDVAERVRGMVIGTGGTERETLWYELPRLGAKWSTVLDRLRAVDSTTSGTLRDAATTRGPIRGVPLAGDIAFVQPTYSWRPQGAPTLQHVAILMDDTVRVGSSLAQLAGTLPPPAASGTPTLSSDLRARAAALYVRMRDALRRGDWIAFGQAFDELGRIVGGTR